MPVAQTNLWHYTTGEKLLLILESKEIKLTPAGLTKGERPVGWFSTNPIWETTCNKGWRNKTTGEIRTLTKEETEDKSNGLVRIKVKPDVAPYDFEDFKRKSKIPKAVAKGLEIVAYQVGSNPKQWRVSFKPVPQSEWLDIEVWDGVKWNSMINALKNEAILGIKKPQRKNGLRF